MPPEMRAEFERLAVFRQSGGQLAELFAGVGVDMGGRGVVVSAELVEQYKADDPGAFRRLYQQQWPRDMADPVDALEFGTRRGDQGRPFLGDMCDAQAADGRPERFSGKRADRIVLDDPWSEGEPAQAEREAAFRKLLGDGRPK